MQLLLSILLSYIERSELSLFVIQVVKQLNESEKHVNFPAFSFLNLTCKVNGTSVV